MSWDNHRVNMIIINRDAQEFQRCFNTDEIIYVKQDFIMRLFSSPICEEIIPIFEQYLERVVKKLHYVNFSTQLILDLNTSNYCTFRIYDKIAKKYLFRNRNEDYFRSKISKKCVSAASIFSAFIRQNPNFNSKKISYS